MRAKALVSAITFGLLFVLLLIFQAPFIVSSSLAADDGEAIASAVVVQAGHTRAQTELAAASLDTWENFQPSGWVGVTPVTCTVEVYNEGGFLSPEQAEYQYRTGGAWSSWTTVGLEHTWVDVTRRRVTVANLAFTHSITEQQNQINFRYKAASGGWLESGAYSVLVDTVAPSSTVAISPCYGSAMQIMGTATDSGSGVAAVAITLLRTSDSMYYNGSSWQPTARWITASGTTNWSLPFTPTVQTTYLVTSRATDNVGHVQTSYGTGTFAYDATPPESAVLTGGYFRTWAGTIQGSAADAFSGVALVQVTIQRASDTWYYDGTGWGSPLSWITATGTSLWNVAFTPTVETAYTVTSRATDNCGNAQVVPAVGTFTFDITPPTSAVTTTGCFNLWVGAIQGSAADALSGVASVQVSVQRASDSFYYSGSAWGPTSTWITASGTTSWLLPFTPPVETAYTVTSRATDRCGNVQSVSGSGVFSYDVTRPQSSITATSCLDSWPGAIRGAASDTLSGVAYVQVRLQRALDGLYYNGASWATSATWISATGTTSWSLPFTPTVQSLYTVTANSADNCGNAQIVPSVMTFTHDLNPPSSAVSTTGYYSGSIGSIAGTAHDDVSGIGQVEVRVQRGSDGLYYDGASWTVLSHWLPVSYTTAPAGAGQSTAASSSLGQGRVAAAGGDITMLAATGWNAIWTLPFTPTVQSVYTVESRATDHCGNAQTVPGLGAFVYDATPPLPPVSLAVQPSQWTPVNCFTVTWTNLPDLSGPDAVHYKWDSAPISNSDESPGSPVPGDAIQSLSCITVPVQGTHQLFIWLEDKAGNANFQNRNATGAGAFKWDAVPAATTVITRDGGLGCSGWFTSAVQIGLQAVDVNPDPARINATSGVSATFWRKNGGDWQPVVTSTFVIADQGVTTVDYYSLDVAGNVETPPKTISPTLKIDTVPPTTSPPSFTGTLGPSEWYRSGVSVTLAAVDAASGVSTTFHQLDGGTWEQGSSFYILADGVHTIRYYSVDAACNSENPYTATLKIDKTHPSTSHQLDGRLGDNGWFVASPVTVTLSASDVISGVQASSGVDKVFHRVAGSAWQTTISFTVAVPSGQKEYSRTLEYYAVDLAGNAEPTHTLSIGMDFQAPLALPYGPYAVPGGWTNVNCFDIKWYQNPPDFSGIGGAYYNFQEPISDTDGTLFLGDDLTSIPCVQVPDAVGDGLHNLYVWVRDKAGNSDYRTRWPVSIALDRSPPQVAPVVAGNSCGTAGWYNSPITVTFVATDTFCMASGVISYQVNGGGWTKGTSYSESRDDRYVVECRATDCAGNTSDVITRLLKLDRTAPDAPINASVEPAGWSKDGLFTVRWLNPADLSGLGGVYYKQGSPPVSPTDGIYVEGLQSSLSVTATTEGSVPTYVWLVDKACNSDQQKSALVTLKYDHSPPTTTFSVTGTLGSDGWYTSPVTITLHCADNGSGCVATSSHYRIGDGPWQDGSLFLVDAEGTTTFSYYSLDLAGNMESANESTVKIDRDPPSSYAYSEGYSPSPSFTVRWDGADAVSGIATFDVQYKVGACEPWLNWVSDVDPAQRSMLFTGVAGKVYYFRARCKDKAGNVEPYPAAADTYVSVDLVVNGDFERSLGSEWTTAAVCPVIQAYAPSQTGGTTRVAVLGCPDQVTDAPFGESMICQTVSVPSACDMPAPLLQFRYRIFTYDLVWGQATGKYYDSFNVGLSDLGQISPTYVFTDGNWTQDYGTEKDLGWRNGSVDLRPYAGQTIKVCLANVTRVDKAYNTWTYVDDVRVVNLEHRITMPIVQRMRLAQVSSAEERPKATSPDLKGDR
jgi:hypothetical protein